MDGHQGDLALLNDPIAQTLLQSTIPARLAYSWTDGTPRMVPIWFHWTGEEFVLGSPPGAPKLKALAANSAAALTIDENAWPPKVLLVRGSATVQLLDDVSPEYAAAATRYFGEEQGRAWVGQLHGQPMARVAVRPHLGRHPGLPDPVPKRPQALEPVELSSAAPRSGGGVGRGRARPRRGG